MNNISLMGNLGRDWEVKETRSGLQVAKNSLAVRRAYKDKETGEYGTDWFNLTMFGKRIEALQRYSKKGDTLGVAGSVQLNEYTNKNGEYRAGLDVNMSDFTLPPFSSKNNTQQDGGGYQQQHKQSGSFGNNNDVIDIQDDDLPF